LARAIGNIGAIVAGAELEEAATVVDPSALAASSTLVAAGDALRAQALASADAVLLGEALLRYRDATDLLLPLLHPECQTPPELTCQRAVARASAAFAQARIKHRVACTIARLKGGLPPGTDCRNEPKTLAKIAKAAAAFQAALAKSCGGKDKVCTAGSANEQPVALGFDVHCPGLAPALCAQTLGDCSDLAACLTCTGNAAVDGVVDQALGALVSTDPKDKAEKPLNKCQRAIGDAVEELFAARADAHQKCWDARLRGKHANHCPTPGDGKADVAIADADAKLVKKICAACGGADKACGGLDDLTPARIGFAADCADVRVPDGRRCAAPVTSLIDLVGCVGCVTERAVDCLDAASVPDLVTYPSECRP
jgi:hypothetical protein